MPKKNTVSRRDFLGKSGIALGAVAALPGLPPEGRTAAAKLPQRTLGRTGVQVSILTFGCGSRFLMYEAEDAALAILNRAIDLGISYLDTAVAYGEGKSETRVGLVMKTRRKEVFLATKIPDRARTRDAALKEYEASLKRLHTDGAVMAKAIERHDLDCVQMAMNPARANRFEELALPAANRKNLGVILMKVTAQEKLLGADKAEAAALLRYAWSLPVSTVVCGMPRPEFVEANVASARAFAPMPPAEMDRLRERLAGQKVALERFFAGHRDGHTA